MTSTPGDFFKIVLINPEIPGNTGSIGRTCVALNCELILVGKLGFDLSEKAVRRAGLDYWKHVRLKTYPDYETFLTEEKANKENLFFFSRFSTNNYFEAKFIKSCFLIFGSETKGLPQEILSIYPGQTYSIPSFSTEIRSLNLSNAVTAVAYEALRKIYF